MNISALAPEAKKWRVIATLAASLSLAATAVAAQPPFEAGGNPRDLAEMLENISAAPSGERREAADAFVSAAGASETSLLIDATLPALGDSRAEQRYYALVGLGAAGLASMENGEELAEMADIMVNALFDEDASVREAAAAALAAVQPAPPDWAAAPLIELLEDPEPRVASAAMAALERIAAFYTDLDPIFEALYGDSPAGRSRAVRFVGAYSTQTSDRESVWALVRALDDPDAGVRWQAATALGGLGDAGIVAAWDLGSVSGDESEDPMVRRAAGTALNSVFE